MKLNALPLVLQSLLSGSVPSWDSLSSSQLPTASNAHPVCIVGAGPGGLTVAHELEAKQYSTVIFDSQPLVGGKCQAYYNHGPNGTTYHPLGALLFTNETYHNTLPIIQASGAKLSPGISPSLWTRYLYGVGDKAGNVVKQPNPDMAQYIAILMEVIRYSTYWNTEFKPKYTAIRYVNGIPDEYTVPIADFLAAHNYRFLPSIMQAGMVPYGYGDISVTPTMYMLQYFTPEILGVFIGITESYIVDFHEVFSSYATSVKGPINLNTTITKIDRSHPDISVITYTKGSSTASQTCSSVVLAFPPNMRSMQALNMPLSSDETAVFSKVSQTPYWSSAVSVSTPDFTTYQQNPFAQVGEPVAFIRLFDNSNIATSWQWGNIASTDEAKQLLSSTVSAVQAGAGVTPSTVSVDDVKAIRRWNYFPHFASANLSSEAYEQYNALQGKSGTYYSSGLNGFETVEFSIRAAKDLVETYFK